MSLLLSKEVRLTGSQRQIMQYFFFFFFATEYLAIAASPSIKHMLYSQTIDL